MGTYALTNGMSVVKWETPNPAANRALICMTCNGREKCIIERTKTVLLPPPPVNGSSSNNVRIFESTSSKLKFVNLLLFVKSKLYEIRHLMSQAKSALSLHITKAHQLGPWAHTEQRHRFF